MKRKGFTLIELLVVISIIAMLLAILMPALGIVKKKAQSVVCGSNVGQLAKAWFLYCAENDGLVPGSNTVGPPENHDGYVSWVQWPQTEAGAVKGANSTVEEKIWGIKRGSMYPYAENPKVYHCPGDQRSRRAPVGGSGAGSATARGGYRSYSIVGTLDGEASEKTKIMKQGEIRRPSSKMVYLEEADGRGYNMNSWIVSINGTNWIDPISIWHKDSSTLGFADGHAVNHKWVDKDTIDMAERQQPNMDDPGSVDLKFVQDAYPHK